MKTLSERIAQLALENNYGRNAMNRASFLLVRAEVTDALDDGYSILAIWETLHDEGRICYGYQAFRRYVAQLVPRKPDPSERTTPRLDRS